MLDPNGPQAKYFQSRLKEMQEEDERTRRFILSMRKDSLDELIAFGGSEAEQMIKSRELTEVHLRNPNSALRFVALCLLGNHWPISANIAQFIECMVHSSTDEREICAGILCLQSYYRKTEDASILKSLAEIIQNEAMSSKVRETAYLALYQISGKIGVGPSLLAFRFPNDIDWIVVKSFL